MVTNLKVKCSHPKWFWSLTQEKTQRNQQPLFDIFDDTGTSYSDTIKYEANNFTETKFSYKMGLGTNDTELGFLSYRYDIPINVGDIVFTYDIRNTLVGYRFYIRYPTRVNYLHY